MPFSFPSILESSALQSILVGKDAAAAKGAQAAAAAAGAAAASAEDAGAGSSSSEKGKGKEKEVKPQEKVKKGPLVVNLGEWEVGELQICKMGSWGPDGEYVADARCPLE